MKNFSKKNCFCVTHKRWTVEREREREREREKGFLLLEEEEEEEEDVIAFSRGEKKKNIATKREGKRTTVWTQFRSLKLVSRPHEFHGDFFKVVSGTWIHTRARRRYGSSRF